VSFKFKLGQLVIHPKKLHHGPAKIEAFHLNGFMRISLRDKNTKYIVKETDYEVWNEEEVIKFDY